MSERDANLTDNLYGSDESLQGMYGDSLRESVSTLRDSTGMTEADGNAHLIEVARFARDAGIPPSEIPALHSLLVQHVAKPADDATVQGWAIASLRGLRERYGEEGQARLESARSLIDTAHPGLKKLLNQSGIGAHPKVVLDLAERVPRFKTAGKK